VVTPSPLPIAGRSRVTFYGAKQWYFVVAGKGRGRIKDCGPGQIYNAHALDQSLCMKEPQLNHLVRVASVVVLLPP
jgi:hypothetical protein